MTPSLSVLLLAQAGRLIGGSSQDQNNMTVARYMYIDKVCENLETIRIKGLNIPYKCLALF